MARRRGAGLVVTAVAILGALAGLALALGGAWLIVLGGSWFYLPAGLAMIAAAFFLFRGETFAAWIALGLLAVAALWTGFEAGTAFWPWFSRIATFLAIAVVVLILAPGLRGPGERWLARPFAWGGAGVLGLALAGLLAGMFFTHPVIRADGSPLAAFDAQGAVGGDWPAYGRSTSGTRFAGADQITPGNVSDLRVAWTFRTGDMAVDGAEFQGTPIKVNGSVYLCTPRNIVIALDPDTGAEKWRHDPQAKAEDWIRCRGVGYGETPAANAAAPCQKRVVLTTVDARLMTLDADTGRPCADFGEDGQVNLLTGLGPTAPGSYYPTSAPLVAGSVVVVGGKINDNLTTGEPSGVVRAYDLRTGQLRWAWDATNPMRGSAPLAEGEIYPPETPNFWGTASYDPALGLVYFPTGNQTPDFWGGNRHPASDTYNDAVVAVDANTGLERWHFRTVNHDLYDYDVAAQPILYDLPDGQGGTTPVLVLLTKRGQIFVLDRRTGEPVIPVEERPVPTEGALEGQRVAPTQPYSALSVGTERLRERDMWGATIFDQLYCRIQFKRMRYEGEFTPINFQRTIVYPGYYGGFNWGGGAIDEATGQLVVNDIRMAQWGRFLTREEAQRTNLQPSSEGEYSEQLGTPYGIERSMFVSPLGVPCFNPPFGTMSAIDLRTGTIRWQAPVGSIQDASVRGITPGVYVPIGMPTMGGPLTTRTGLVFFSGSLDAYVRAWDVRTGKEIWRERLPVPSQAAPMSYVSDATGKQYVLVTAGGATRTNSDKNRGDYVIAYALP